VNAALELGKRLKKRAQPVINPTPPSPNPKPQTQLQPQSLKGHGKDIHDVAVHPTRPQLVLTGSKDESIRCACFVLGGWGGGVRL